MSSGKIQSVVFTDIAIIVIVWATLIATMLALQAMGFEFGFDLWPVGEFRNWIEFLRNGHGYGAAKLFWEVDNRNALSPWWYLAARPLIDAVPTAPLILYLMANLFVGIAAYLLLAELTRSRAFALTVGILSAPFIANVFRDGVIWNLVAALGCTLLSIWLFALFVDDRRRTGYLIASYLFWFVAISTYTIQIGGVCAVFLVSTRQRLAVMSWPNAIFGALIDAFPFAGFLALYLMLWITTSSVGVPAAINLQFSFDALTESIAFGIWNEHYQFFWIWLIAAGPKLMILVFGFLILTMLLLLHRNQCADYAKPTMKSLGFVFLIGVCVVGPTIGVETLSDQLTPGTRWPMVMQFWSPFVFSILVFTTMHAVPDRFWWPLWRGLIASAAAFVILLGVGFNRTQVRQVRQERAFFTELQSIVNQDRASGVKFPRRYLIQLIAPALFLPVDRLADPYAHTILGRDVTFRVVTNLPGPSEENTMLIWKDQHLSRPGPATSSEPSSPSRARP